MIEGRDSSLVRPSGLSLLAAANAGVKVWGGYIQTKPDVNLAAAWQLADFDEARKLGGVPLAFCSGWDDPAALRTLARQWNVRLCLDVENGIRPDGTWKVRFLDESGAGLYGNRDVHNVAAPFHVLADYQGIVPTSTWLGGLPPDDNPRGWQWQGTHSEFGLSVDSLILDDWFGSATPDPIAQFGGMPVVETYTGTDGSLHSFELPAFGSAPVTITWTRTDPNNFDILSRQALPGEWVTIERVGRFEAETFLRGTGVDGALWQTTLPDGATTWTAPGKLA